MIWLASFPRSGNTFFRNILFDVYGIESGIFKPISTKRVPKHYQVVKTHMLPYEIIPSKLSIPAIYLIRDGRDAVVSMAHQWADITEPGTDFNQNLRSIIAPKENEHFGGWRKNVELWLSRADIIIRFEDLIKNPISEIEKLRQLKGFALPEPSIEKLPTFESQRNGIPKYSPNKGGKKKNELNSLFFRKGKVGGWKDDMSDEMHNFFWSIHGKTMKKLGYGFNGDVAERPAIDFNTIKQVNPTRHILMSAKHRTIFYLKKRIK